MSYSHTRGAILAGGPFHGKRVDEATGHEIVMVYSPPMPLAATPLPPRPKPWRDPAGWLRWKPGITIAATETPPISQHLYRLNGELRDGVKTYWWQGEYAGGPPADPDEVLRTVYDAFRKTADPELRARGHIEMDHAWYAAVRRAATGQPGMPAPGDLLLGYPVKVTAGSPRLVMEDTP